MDTSFNELGQIGVMGLWTLSLLHSNAKMRKDFQERYDSINQDLLKKAIETHQVLDCLLKEIRESNSRTKKKGINIFES